MDSRIGRTHIRPQVDHDRFAEQLIGQLIFIKVTCLDRVSRER